jgi:hypothetical protein
MPLGWPVVVCPGWVGVVEGADGVPTVPPPPHPTRLRQIRTISASVVSFKFELIFLKLPEAFVNCEV